MHVDRQDAKFRGDPAEAPHEISLALPGDCTSTGKMRNFAGTPPKQKRLFRGSPQKEKAPHQAGPLRLVVSSSDPVVRCQLRPGACIALK